MRPLLLLLALFVLADLTQCGGSTPRIDWPHVAQCGAHDAPEELFERVADVLVGVPGDTSTTIGERAIAQLEQLATERGAALVECFVDEVVRSYGSLGGNARALMAAPIASPSPAQLAAARGRDFLQRVAKARVERDE